MIAAEIRHIGCFSTGHAKSKWNSIKNRISFTGDLNLRILIFLFAEIGATIKIVTDDQYKEKCTKDILWVDYKNISKVLVPGARIFIDDGLISVIAKECGPDYVIGEIENSGNLGSKKGTFQSMHNLRHNIWDTVPEINVHYRLTVWSVNDGLSGNLLDLPFDPVLTGLWSAFANLLINFWSLF